MSFGWVYFVCVFRTSELDTEFQYPSKYFIFHLFIYMMNIILYNTIRACVWANDGVDIVRFVHSNLYLLLVIV